LNVSKPFLISGCDIPAASAGDNNPPAILLIRDYCKRRPDAAFSIEFLRVKPAEINAGNALFSHGVSRDRFLA